jgi:hypothetical protein
MQDVEIVHAVVDLHEVESYRAAKASMQVQAASVQPLHRIQVPFKLCRGDPTLMHSQLSLPLEPQR